LRKQLPGGMWMTLRNLPLQTTDEEIQAALAEGGIDIPLDLISCDTDCNPFVASVVICVQRTVILDLLRRALLRETGEPIELHGRPLVPLLPNNKARDSVRSKQ
jgi:hypothetical protein